MTALIAGLGITTFALLLASFRRKSDITDIALWAFSLWIMSYILSSATLIFLNIFTILRAACVAGAIPLLLLIIFAIRRSAKPSFSISAKSLTVTLIVAMFTFGIASHNNFAYFGMGQDEGVYQTEAFCYINGMTEREFDYEEYEICRQFGLIDRYSEQLFSAPNIAGAYRAAGDTNNISEVLTGTRRGAVSDTSAVFHGLHTYSALMALWGDIFGIRNMNNINAFLLALCALWIIRICRETDSNLLGTAAAVICTILSPQVLWCSKSALAETGLMLIWLIYIYSLICKSRLKVYLSALCITVYGFFHISIYAFLPLYIAIFIFLFLYNADTDYLKGLILSLAGYLSAFIYSLITACFYTLSNYKIIFIGFINADNVTIVVSVAVFVLIIATSGLLLACRGRGINRLRGISSFLRKDAATVAIGIIYKILLVLLVSVLLVRCFRSDPTDTSPAIHTFFAFGTLCGFVPLIIGLIYLLFVKVRSDKAPTLYPLFVIFMYCVPIYSLLFIKRIGYYFYYSRYLDMYIAVIGIISALAITYFCRRFKGVKKNILSGLSCLSVLLTLVYLWPKAEFVISSRDDSRYDWENITQVCDMVFDRISEGSDVAVFIRPDLYAAYFYPLKAIGAHLYPITDDFEKNYDNISANYDETYLIDGITPYDYSPDGSVNYVSHAAEQGYSVVMVLHNNISEDLRFYLDEHTKLPSAMYIDHFLITVYRYSN